jgi:hypothetical protein
MVISFGKVNRLAGHAGKARYNFIKIEYKLKQRDAKTKSDILFKLGEASSKSVRKDTVLQFETMNEKFKYGSRNSPKKKKNSWPGKQENTLSLNKLIGEFHGRIEK